MSDRDRLVELLKEADDATEVHDCDYPTYEKAMQAFYTSIADHLLANGVIVLPCAVGDTVWNVNEYAEGFKVRPMQVESMTIKAKDKKYVYLEYTDKKDNLAHGYAFEDFGDVLFLTKEEAEAKLAELKGE